jgi:hypothetical protein
MRPIVPLAGIPIPATAYRRFSVSLEKPSAPRHSFEFEYTVTDQGVPQPYPVKPPNSRVLFRLSPAEDDNGQKLSVLNICGNREGLEYLAAMLVLSGDSAKYDPEFHIHLGDMEEFETDMDVTIRAPAYLDSLDAKTFSEARGTPIQP